MARILFVTEANVGGSPRSQRELAHQLLRRGHEVRFLAVRPKVHVATRAAYDKLSDASVRFPGLVGQVAKQARRLVGRHVTPATVDGLPYVYASIAANGLPRALDLYRPDVVVANSVERWTWRQIHETCRARRIATILYVREDDSLKHLDAGAVPDVLVANAASLARTLASNGHECHFIPSVVDTAVTETQSSRQCVLAINPIPSRGGAIFWAVAERLPTIPFVMQEAWPLEGEMLRETLALAALYPNVEFRRRIPPSPELYRDAKLLMVPYRVDNRPRVILEAQANGIPAVVGDVPALIEAVGDAGLSVPLDDVEQWSKAIAAIWEDDAHYADLVEAARRRSRLPDVDPAQLTSQFEVLVDQAIDVARAS